MYAEENVGHFLDTHRDHVTPVLDADIRAAARRLSRNGLFSGSQVADVFAAAPELGPLFEADFEEDPERLRIAIKALTQEDPPCPEGGTPVLLDQLYGLVRLMATALLYDSRATATVGGKETVFHTGRVGIYQEVGSRNLHFFAETLRPDGKGFTWDVPLLFQGDEGTISIDDLRLIVRSPDPTMAVEIDLR